MKYGPIAETPLENYLLSAPQGARAMFDTMIPLMLVKTIMVSTRLGLFDKLVHRPMSAGELRTVMDVDEEILALMLRMLWGAGYLTRAGDLYELTPVGRGNLVGESGGSCKAHVLMFELLWNNIGDMENVVRTGKGLDVHEYLRTPEHWRIYQNSMLERARTTASAVAPWVPVPKGATRLLDIAGSHGLFGAAICRAHPPLRSEVIDLPEAVERARELARLEGIADVVSHRAGDALVEGLGTGHDVVLVNNLLHHFTREQSMALLHRVRASMNASGTVAVWEICPHDQEGPPDVATDGMALFVRTTSSGRCHSSAEYAAWLEHAGFNDISVRRIPMMPHQALVTGRVPG